jgi:twitching motility two-component system response regulator PilG
MNAVSKRPIIWVIDDSPTIRKIVAVALSREAGEVIEYAEPLQVLRDVTRSHLLPDVALVDLQLPRMSGYKLIQLLRSCKQASQMAIIVITRRDGAYPQLLARLAGANAYLLKPFTVQQLLALVIEHSPH